MIIDLQRCVGCGGCSIACKNENNVPDGIYWSNKITETSGTFPDVLYHYIPTLCNHCANAPCARGCPTKAMHKLENGITMHDPDKCIGCKYCEFNCPYGVIYFNWRAPHQFWRQSEQLIKGVTSAPAEEAKKVNTKVLPYYNSERDATLPGIRPKGVVEKCTFCDHRVKRNLLPYCVVACPADARIFGDIQDPNSEVSQLLGKFRNPAHYQPTKGGV
jgi:molybdopterin-containing oxidoreductase family iron-sulfur binding subunit